MEINGKEISTVVKNEAFPTLLKEITVDLKKCKPDCKLICQEECPTKVINVKTKISKTGQISRIIDVIIDRTRCIYCKRCELACPHEAIKVEKPFQGTIGLEADLCPEGCKACIEICTPRAIQQNEDGKPLVQEEYCIYCGACQRVCPKEAIEIRIKRVSHTDIRSAVWLTALKKIASHELVTDELLVKAGRKKRSVIKDRYR